jgi:hypothetical protein
MAKIEERKAALANVRRLISGDGADFQLLSELETDEVVRLELVIPDGTCSDCIMPREFLEQTASEIFRAADKGVRTVEILDPREQSADAPAQEHA